MTTSTRHPMTPAVPPQFIEDIYTPDETAVLFDIVRQAPHSTTLPTEEQDSPLRRGPPRQSRRAS